MSQFMVIDGDRLHAVCRELMDGHVKYKFGGKAPSLTVSPSQINAIDCSGFVRYVLYQSAINHKLWPDGSINQQDYCKKNDFDKCDYGETINIDGLVRIAFITTPTRYRHVWLTLNGQTLESHGSKGPNRRPWDQAILKTHVDAAYVLGSAYMTTLLTPRVPYTLYA